MKLLIVPDSLRNGINKALNEAYAKCPEAPVEERELHYQFLINFFDENGYVPEFELKQREHPEIVP